MKTNLISSFFFWGILLIIASGDHSAISSGYPLHFFLWNCSSTYFSINFSGNSLQNYNRIHLFKNNSVNCFENSLGKPYTNLFRNPFGDFYIYFFSWKFSEKFVKMPFRNLLGITLDILFIPSVPCFQKFFKEFSFYFFPELGN